MPVPAGHTNACVTPLVVSAEPTTTPASFTSEAIELAPPSVPRSVIPVVADHRKARRVRRGSGYHAQPTT